VDRPAPGAKARKIARGAGSGKAARALAAPAGPPGRVVHSAGSPVKTTVLLGALSAANIGLTFLFQWYVLVTLGPGASTDALFGGMTLVQFAITLTSTSLTHVLVPILAGQEEAALCQDAWSFVVLVGSLFLGLALLLYLTAPWWVPLTVPGFDAPTMELTVTLARIQLPGMVFAALNAIQWAAYRARQRFLWAEFSPVVAAAFALLALRWGMPRAGVVAAAWVGTLRWGLQTVLLLPAIGPPVWPGLGRPSVKLAWKRLRPLLAGNLYYKTDPLVDRFMLSQAGSGSLSLYHLALQIYGAANQVINRALAVPYVPRASLEHRAGRPEAARALYRRTLGQVVAVAAAGVLGLLVVGRPALGLLIGHGSVRLERVGELWWVMVWLLGVFVGGALGQISSCSYYARGDTRTPTRLGAWSYTLHLPVKVALFAWAGVPGLALASSLYYLTSFGLQHAGLAREGRAAEVGP
jgi:putative peptidoglycan lipid II flippase